MSGQNIAYERGEMDYS